MGAAARQHAWVKQGSKNECQFSIGAGARGTANAAPVRLRVIAGGDPVNDGALSTGGAGALRASGATTSTRVGQKSSGTGFSMGTSAQRHRGEPSGRNLLRSLVSKCKYHYYQLLQIS